MASLMQLLNLLDEDHVEEPQPRQPRRRNRNGSSAVARRQKPPPDTFSNGGTQNMEGLINNTGYVHGNGNGSIIFGGFDSSTMNFD
ncbi:hypothetical protein MtrunA17_Chr2g0294521 [Medicago truncatula]|uniref:Uncharacterized protein n=1 Tax=Medicago truncatula TaxID=3880 RepID=G7IFZ3_MEDTR|nr:hypothetical protein MTR_2g034350 [Medicago truncatula]RHN73069.1 hypothetical protein MtrunA17_Chr2g0294521 [Medicago truncatula]